MKSDQMMASFSGLDLQLAAVRRSFEQCPVPTVLVEGPSHLATYVNAAFCSLLNLTAKELVGKAAAEFWPGEDDCIEHLNQASRLGGREINPGEFGTEVETISWSYQMWPLDEEQPLAGIIIQVNESGRLRAKAVAMNEALVLEAVRQHALRGDVDAANASLRVEIRERTQAEEALVAAKTELSARAKDLEEMAARLENANGTLDDRATHLEALVRQRTEKLLETVAELEGFSYSIAHDLRAPLRSMQTFGEILLQEHTRELNDEGRQFLERIVKSASRMDQLIRDVLSYSQVLRENFPLEPVDVQQLVLELIGTYPECAPERANVVLEGPFPAVLGNAAILTQIFSHLLANAVKFAKPRLKAQIKLWSESRDGQIRFFIRDRGIGIPPDQYERIFGIFEQLDKSYEGTGIGLAIVKKAVERMRGKIGVGSELGQSTTFWFELQKA